jgi:prepilin-type N-terminal cleavage/methylation domain-containing protein
MKTRKEKGFTIIEVALVLAIAGLIFLVVFLAVPALQRNQRDDARKRDVSNIVAAVTTVASNTSVSPTVGAAYNGTPKATGGSTLGAYLDKMSNNVDYVNVVVYGTQTLSATNPAKNATAASTTPQLNQVVVFTGAQCVGNTNIQAASKRMSAVVVQIENGGDGKYYCQDAS